MGFPGGSLGKESACNTGDTRAVDLIPRSGRSSRGGHGNPLQYSCLENPTDRRTWRARVHGSQRLGHDWSDWTQHICYSCLNCPTDFDVLFCFLHSLHISAGEISIGLSLNSFLFLWQFFIHWFAHQNCSSFLSYFFPLPFYFSLS